MARPVEDDDDHVADRPAAALGDQLAGLDQRPVEVEQVGDVFTAGELFHVDAGARVEHRAFLGQRDHRERARHAQGAEARALERVDGDVDLGRAAVADVLAVEEHRGFVLLPLADHDDAVHRDRVEDVAHRVDGGTVGGELVAAADPAGRREGGRLGDPDELQGEVAIRLGLLGRRHRPEHIGSRRGRTLGSDPAADGGAARRARRVREARRGGGLHRPVDRRDGGAGRLHAAGAERRLDRADAARERHRRRLPARPGAAGAGGGGARRRLRRALRARHRHLLGPDRRRLERDPVREAAVEDPRDARIPPPRARGRAHLDPLQARNEAAATRCRS